MEQRKEKITTATIVRTVCLVLALVNQGLSIWGYSPLPVENETVAQLVSLLMTTAAALTAWWKNNSFTQRAIKADQVLKEGSCG